MGDWKTDLYAKMPRFIQNVMVSTYGWQWKRLRLGGIFAEEVDGFLAREQFSRRQWQDYTLHRLQSLLQHAFENVPFYHDNWTRLGLNSATLSRFNLDDLRRLPPLDKDVARKSPEQLLVGGRPDRRHFVLHTSGSTGTPVKTYWLPEEKQRGMALRAARSCKFADVDYGMPRATFGGRFVEPDPESTGPFYRYNWFERQVYLSAFHLRPDTAYAYLDAIDKHNVKWLNGYANSIYQLARMSLEQHLEIPEVKAVITTSEKVTSEMRETIERAFSTEVYEEYGTVEDVFYVCECEFKRKHINPDAGIVEIVDENFEPLPDGQEGEVLATGFIRPSQPMIRYRVGDRAVLDDEPCPCGRQMPVLREVLGRSEDTVYGPDGRRMVRFHGIFTDQPHVKEGQVVQESLDRLRLRVVATPDFGDQDKQDMVSRVHQRLTNKVEVDIEVVDRIERTPAGKFQAVVSELSPEQIKQGRKDDSHRI